MTGIIALYIFMLAAFTGYEIIAKVPVILVVGKREVEEGTVNMRRLGSPQQQAMSLDAAVQLLRNEALPPDIRRGGGGYSAASLPSRAASS